MPGPQDPTNVNELIDALNEKTYEDPSPAPAPGSGATIVNENGDDFDPAPKMTDEDRRLQEEKLKQQPAPEYSPTKAKSTAKTWTKWLSSLMRFTFPYFYKRTILAKGDVEKMKVFVDQHKGMSEKQMEDAINNDQEMFSVNTRFDRYLKAIDSVKFTDEEMDYIAEPLSDLIIKYRHLQLGPEWSLVLAVAIVMLPRFEPMFPGLGKIFSSAEKKANGN
jgi:hypothetical protein